MYVAAPTEPLEGIRARVSTLLRKMPQGEEDWNSKVPSFSRLQEYHHILLLPHATPETGVEELFTMYSQFIRGFMEREAEVVVDYLKVLALGTGNVILAEHQAGQRCDGPERRVFQRRVCEGVRLCFRSAGSKSTLIDQRLLEYMTSISRGVELMHCLEIFLTRRAYEIPLQGMTPNHKK